MRARERDRRAVELRAAGLTFSAIGAERGLTGEAARQAVNCALEATADSIAQEANRLRALEAERLDHAAAVLMAEIEAGNLRAHEVWLRSRTRYVALLGLDLKPEADVSAPLTVVLTGTARPEEAPEGAYVIDARLPWDRESEGQRVSSDRQRGAGSSPSPARASSSRSHDRDRCGSASRGLA